MSSKTENSDENKVVAARVSPERHQEIRIEAARRDQSIAEYIRDLIGEDLE